MHLKKNDYLIFVSHFLSCFLGGPAATALEMSEEPGGIGLVEMLGLMADGDEISVTAA